LLFCVKLHLRDERSNERTDGEASRSFICLCALRLSGASILCGETNFIHRNLRGRITNKYTKFGQLIIRKIIKIIAAGCRILRLKCTKFDSRRMPVRLCLDTVDESQRRRHSVTAAIVVDVLGARRPCVSLCPSVVRPSLRWSLTLYDGACAFFAILYSPGIRATAFAAREVADRDTHSQIIVPK